MTSPLILVARGSRDPLANHAAVAVAARVAAAHPGRRVRAAFLGAEVPSLPAALAKEAGLAHRQAIVAPLLLTAGRYSRVTLPDTVRGAGGQRLPIAVRVAETLAPVEGPEPDLLARDLLVRALRRRLAETAPGPPVDAIVLAAAGSHSTRAMQTAADLARALCTATGTPCRPAFTSIGARVGDTITALRQAGAGAVAVVPYLLSPGLLYRRVLVEAGRAGAVSVAAPLGDAPEIAELVTARAERAGW